MTECKYNKIKPEDTEAGKEYYYLEICIPSLKVKDISVFTTREDRDKYELDMTDHYNVLYNGRKMKKGPPGVNRGNCVSSFIGKWRFIREEAGVGSDDDDEETKTKLLQEVTRV